MSSGPLDRPLLQLALDETDLGRAREVASAAAEWVDVLEVGTLLLAAAGVPAVAALRADHPDHQIVADLRISRAGRALAELCFDAGASAVTVMAEAPTETRRAAIEVARARRGIVEIELGETWTVEQLARWVDDGATGVILHQGVEADSVGPGWSDADLQRVEEAAATGLRVSVTGGIAVEELDAFAGIPVGIVIAGRAIRRAEDPAVAAETFHRALVGLAR